MEDDAELPHWSRTYASYAERFKNPYVLQLTPTVQVELLQAPCVSSQHAKEASASADGLCTASTVWDAGIVLAAHVYNYLTARKVVMPMAESPLVVVEVGTNVFIAKSISVELDLIHRLKSLLWNMTPIALPT